MLVGIGVNFNTLTPVDISQSGVITSLIAPLPHSRSFTNTLLSFSKIYALSAGTTVTVAAYQEGDFANIIFQNNSLEIIQIA
jgi:hypothetical protein